MEILIISLVIVAVILITVKNRNSLHSKKIQTRDSTVTYRYNRKESIMTSSEVAFYKRLQKITQGRYIIFPQIHLSALAINKTEGRYRKLGFQRINRRSVDYILADPGTLTAIYAVELDDYTHDTAKGRAIDNIKTEILDQISLPLVRFRNIGQLTDEQIIAAFQAVHQQPSSSV